MGLGAAPRLETRRPKRLSCRFVNPALMIQNPAASTKSTKKNAPPEGEASFGFGAAAFEPDKQPIVFK